jgi:group II intron reverse transcriptase/maturase
MARVARRVGDRKVLKLIRSYLNAGVMADGVKQPSEEGTPQGSPLSPLLSNVYLDDLDRELERRGHCFVRYADDVMIYVKSKRAAQRVLASVGSFVEERLGLRVNHRKSAVAWAGKRTFLGFAFYKRKDGWKIAVAREAPQRAKQRLRQLTARTWSVSMERRIDAINRFTRGWTAYFRLGESELPFHDLDEWLRRMLRQVRWTEWKLPKARRRNLRALGVAPETARQFAGTGKGPWRIANTPVLGSTLSNTYWREQGLEGFLSPYRRFRDAERTAGCGPACPVVWEGPG